MEHGKHWNKKTCFNSLQACTWGNTWSCGNSSQLSSPSCPELRKPARAAGIHRTLASALTMAPSVLAAVICLQPPGSPPPALSRHHSQSQEWGPCPGSLLWALGGGLGPPLQPCGSTRPLKGQCCGTSARRETGSRGRPEGQVGVRRLRRCSHQRAGEAG